MTAGEDSLGEGTGSIFLHMPDLWLNDEIEVHKLLMREGNIIDAGANQGEFTEAMLAAGASVIAFEPIHDYARGLREKCPKAEVIEAALYNKEDVMNLNIPMVCGTAKVWECASVTQDFTGLCSFESIKVKAITLDSLNLSEVSAMKIDVEGAELEVLQGALNTIKSKRPFISAELEERHRESCTKEVPDFMVSLNYDCFFRLYGGFLPISDFYAPILQFADSKVGGCVGSPYVNTFYFLPREIGWFCQKLRLGNHGPAPSPRLTSY